MRQGPSKRKRKEEARQKAQASASRLVQKLDNEFDDTQVSHAEILFVQAASCLGQICQDCELMLSSCVCKSPVREKHRTEICEAFSRAFELSLPLLGTFSRLVGHRLLFRWVYPELHGSPPWFPRRLPRHVYQVLLADLQLSGELADVLHRLPDEVACTVVKEVLNDSEAPLADGKFCTQIIALDLVGALSAVGCVCHPSVQVLISSFARWEAELCDVVASDRGCDAAHVALGSLLRALRRQITEKSPTKTGDPQQHSLRVDYLSSVDAASRGPCGGDLDELCDAATLLCRVLVSSKTFSLENTRIPPGTVALLAASGLTNAKDIVGLLGVSDALPKGTRITVSTKSKSDKSWGRVAFPVRSDEEQAALRTVADVERALSCMEASDAQNKNWSVHARRLRELLSAISALSPVQMGELSARMAAHVLNIPPLQPPKDSGWLEAAREAVLFAVRSAGSTAAAQDMRDVWYGRGNGMGVAVLCSEADPLGNAQSMARIAFNKLTSRSHNTGTVLPLLELSTVSPWWTLEQLVVECVRNKDQANVLVPHVRNLGELVTYRDPSGVSLIIAALNRVAIEGPRDIMADLWKANLSTLVDALVVPTASSKHRVAVHKTCARGLAALSFPSCPGGILLSPRELLLSVCLPGLARRSRAALPFLCILKALFAGLPPSACAEPCSLPWWALTARPLAVLTSLVSLMDMRHDPGMLDIVWLASDLFELLSSACLAWLANGGMPGRSDSLSLYSLFSTHSPLTWRGRDILRDVGRGVARAYSWSLRSVEALLIPRSMAVMCAPALGCRDVSVLDPQSDISIPLGTYQTLEWACAAPWTLRQFKQALSPEASTTMGALARSVAARRVLPPALRSLLPLSSTAEQRRLLGSPTGAGWHAGAVQMMLEQYECHQTLDQTTCAHGFSRPRAPTMVAVLERCCAAGRGSAGSIFAIHSIVAQVAQGYTECGVSATVLQDVFQVLAHAVSGASNIERDPIFVLLLAMAGSNKMGSAVDGCAECVLDAIECLPQSQARMLSDGLDSQLLA